MAVAATVEFFLVLLWYVRYKSNTVNSSTRGGADASLIVQQLDVRLDLADSVRMAARVRLAVIPSADKALRNLGMFAFFASHFFSARGRHISAVADVLRLIDTLEDLHT